MAQDSLRHTSKRPRDCPKTDPSALRAFNGTLQDAKILQKPRENQCFRHSRLFASDGLWHPQDGPKLPQESPKRGPRRPKTAPRAAKNAPRTAQDGSKTAFVSLRGGGGNWGTPSFLAMGPKTAPRGLQDSIFAGSLQGLCRLPPAKILQRPCKEGTPLFLAMEP